MTSGTDPRSARTPESPGPCPDVVALGAKCRTIKLPCGIEFSVVVDVEAEDVMSRSLLSGSCPEQTLVELMLSLVQPGDLVLDLGAHVGTFTLAAAAAGCAVIAVEASPRNAAFLRAGIAANGFDRVHIESAAVGEGSGTAEFCPRGAFGHISTPLTDFERIDVPVVSVDELLARLGAKHVAFVKMDVEGSEVRVIRGMSRLLSRPDSPPVLYESNGHTLWFYGQRPRRVKAAMESAGYRNYLVGEAALTPVIQDDLQIDCRVDYLAVKGELPASARPTVRAPLSRSEVVERIVAAYENPDEPSRAYLLREVHDAPDWLRSHPMVKETLRRLGYTSSGDASRGHDELDAVIEIRDPEIDVGDLLQRIRRNLATREELPPVVLPPDRLRMQHEALVRAVAAVRQAAERYGIVSSAKGGWRGRAEVFLKRCIRKLVRRHIDQQSEVHWNLVALLEQMVAREQQVLGYLERTARSVDRQDQFVVGWLDRIAERLDALETAVRDPKENAAWRERFDVRECEPPQDDRTTGAK